MRFSHPVRYSLLLAVTAAAGVLIPLSAAHADIVPVEKCEKVGRTPDTCVRVEVDGNYVKSVKGGVLLESGHQVQGYFKIYTAHAPAQADKTDPERFANRSGERGVLWSAHPGRVEKYMTRANTVCAAFVEVAPDTDQKIHEYVAACVTLND